LRIGYVFDPDLEREIVQGESVRFSVRFHLRLGPATRAAFGRVFAAALADAVDLTGAIPTGATERAGSIRLRLASASMQSAGEGTTTTAFELIFLNPDGGEEGSWHVRGAAAGSGPRAVELAIRAAAAEVASQLDQQPVIRNWLGHGAAAGTSPTGK
jgi:hypothetical protein